MYDFTVYVDEFRFGFNPRPEEHDPLDKAILLARRAVEVAPDNAFAWLALFETDFFRGDLEQAFSAGERAIALNPHDPELKALVGMRLAHAGQWERGVTLVEDALASNPTPPGWYYFALSMNEFRQGAYADALRWAELIDMPGLFWTHVVLAAIHGQLGRAEEAGLALRHLLELYPRFEERALVELRRQHFQPAVLDRMVDGLRRAGLKIPKPAGIADKLG